VAIDSALKRASVQSYTLGLMRPFPDGTVAATDRAMAGWHYAGLTYQVFVFAPTTPAGWYSFHQSFHIGEFIDLMKAEAEGVGNWTNWALGVDLGSDPIPKLGGNLEFNYDYFYAEARGDAIWCRWKPQTQPGNEGNAEINLQVGEEINFA